MKLSILVFISVIFGIAENNQPTLIKLELIKNFPQHLINKFNDQKFNRKQPEPAKSKWKFIQWYRATSRSLSKLLRKLDIQIEYRPYMYKNSSNKVIWIPFDKTSNHYIIG